MSRPPLVGNPGSKRALDALRQLDLVQAVERRLADPAILDNVVDNRLPLADGIQIYRDHVGRSPVTGGTGKSPRRGTGPFSSSSRSPRIWVCDSGRISVRHLDQYAGWLDGEGYAYRTTYIELTTIKQAMNYLIDLGHLPEACRIHLKLSKMTGTDTYCWHQEEVQAILDRCRVVPELGWLGDVLTALSCRGMAESRSWRVSVSPISTSAPTSSN